MSKFLPIDKPAPNWIYWISWIAVLAIVLATGYRVYHQYHDGGEYSADRAGMADFHNGVYYPSQAFIDGVIPYGEQAKENYPIARPSPAFSPFVFLLHVPVAMISLPMADVVCFFIVAILLAVFVWLLLNESASDLSHSWLPVVLCVLLMSRPAHMTLVSGYFTGELVVGVLVALRFAKHKPWLAGIGLLFAASKPTFAIPLSLMLLYRGNWRALTWGVALSVVGAATATAWLAYYNGLTAIVDAIREGQAAHMADEFELPSKNWTRVDAFGIVAKWLAANPSELSQLFVSIGLSLIPGVALRKLSSQGDDYGATTTSGAIAILGIVVILYHHVYDALICLGPIVGLAFVSSSNHSQKKSESAFSLQNLGTLPRYILLLLVSMPAWNYFSSEAILVRLQPSPFVHRILTSLNAVALTTALLCICILVFKQRHSGQKPNS